ncbi:MAG: hypothetical protein DIU78_007495 [Pseudomonadota bacterium]
MNFRHVTLLTGLALATAMACGGSGGGAEPGEDTWPADGNPRHEEQDANASDRPGYDGERSRDTEAPVRESEGAPQSVEGVPPLGVPGGPPGGEGSPGGDDCLLAGDACAICECVFGRGHENCAFSCD